jgi:HK97 family phage major capsid protein
MSTVQNFEQQYGSAVREWQDARARNLDPATIKAKLDRVEEIRGKLDQARNNSNLTAEIDRVTSGMSFPNGRPGGRSIGDLIINSDTGKWLREPSNVRASSWRSPASEIPIPWHGADFPIMRAATLTGDPASGGDLIIPTYVPGILPLPTRQPRVADLFAYGATESNAIVYMMETAFINAAAAVAEGAAKPESTLTFDAITEPVRKIATWLPVTDEMLDDVAALKTYLDARLRSAIELTVEDQLISGNGTAPNISGVLDRPGLAPPLARVDPDTNIDAIVKQASAIFTATNLKPTAAIVHPTNALSIRLAKTTTGEYLSKSPLDDLTIVETPAIAVNTALVGAFNPGGQIFWRAGLKIEVSNSHADFFVTNKVAVLAEVRLALAIYRPAAFGVVTGLN